MSEVRNCLDVQLTLLRERVRLSLAFEEVAIRVLHDNLLSVADRITELERQGVERQIRSHRIGIIKQRAIMGALGIDV